MRKRIFQTVHMYNGNATSIVYKYFMILFIVLSIVPLTFKESNEILRDIEFLCLVVFVIDYMLRWCTADLKLKNESFVAFLKFPFRLISIVDILSVFALLSSVCGWFEGTRAVAVMAVFRIVRVFRYSKNARTILNILRISRKPLFAVGGLAVGYIVISAIFLFKAEPDTFNTFFDAVYWSTISLTTVGYGDIYPLTDLGRTIAMISSFFGVAIVALPAGIVTAEYMTYINKETEKK